VTFLKTLQMPIMDNNQMPQTKGAPTAGNPGAPPISVSDDEFHRVNKNDRSAEFARQAAQQLGIPTATICIEPPSVSPQAAEGQRGKPVVGGGVLFKGRAAEKLTVGLPLRPCEELTTCPHEDLLSPERVHVDAYGNVHLCAKG